MKPVSYQLLSQKCPKRFKHVALKQTEQFFHEG